jgi:hypothetical protein
MASLEAATPAHRGDDAGRQENATLGSSQTFDTANHQPIQEPSPAVQAVKAALVRELLGESLAIGIEYAAKSLRHVLAADDSAAIVACRGFLAAARTAHDCAQELSRLAEAGGQ